MSRLSTLGYKVRGLGTLWSLYREQNSMHRAIVKAAGRNDTYFERLPKPFETIIPNATKIAEATDLELPQQPASFTAKYTSPFAKLFEAVCDEIVNRAEWSPPIQQKDSSVGLVEA